MWENYDVERNSSVGTVKAKSGTNSMGNKDLALLLCNRKETVNRATSFIVFQPFYKTGKAL